MIELASETDPFSQSATSVVAFKSCPTLYFLSYIMRLQPVVVDEALRMGTSWHKCLEILTMSAGGDCPNMCISASGHQCSLCGGSGTLPDDMRVVLVEHLNQAYAVVPPSVESEKWEVERITLLNCALGWLWYWGDDTVETLAREVGFHRTVNSLTRRVGYIDRLIRWRGSCSLGEYKSTGKPIDSGSAYWRGLNANTQLNMYLIEARIAQADGKLTQFGVAPDDPAIAGVLYDVWAKPKTKPKNLTMGATKKFIKDGEYCGQQFEVTVFDQAVSVNGQDTLVTLGTKPKPTKKNPDPEQPFAICETPEMYGARLLADIQERPEKYFARRLIARTDRELEQADAELARIARVVNLMTIRDLWYKNEQHCNATYRCKFFQLCHYGLLNDVREGRIPEGFERKRKHHATQSETNQS